MDPPNSKSYIDLAVWQKEEMAMDRIMKSDKKAGSTSLKRQRKAVTAPVVRGGAFAQINSKPSIADLEPSSLPEPARASASKVSGQFANNVEESSRPAMPFARWNNGINVCVSVIRRYDSRGALQIFSQGQCIEVDWSQFGNLMFMLRGLEGQATALDRVMNYWPDEQQTSAFADKTL